MGLTTKRLAAPLVLMALAIPALGQMLAAPPPATQPTIITARELPTIKLKPGVNDLAAINAAIAEGGTIYVPATVGTSCIIEGGPLDLRPRPTWVWEIERDERGEALKDEKGEPKQKLVPKYHPLSVTVRGDGPASRIFLRNGASILWYGSIPKVENVTIHFGPGSRSVVGGRHPLAEGERPLPAAQNTSVNGSVWDRVFFSGAPNPGAFICYGAEDLVMRNCKWVLSNGTFCFSADPVDLVQFGATADRYGCTNSWVTLDECTFASYGNGETLIKIGGHSTHFKITGWAAAKGQFRSFLTLIGHERRWNRDNIPESIYIDVVPEFATKPGEDELMENARPSGIFRPVSVRSVGRARIGEVTFGPRCDWMAKYAK